MKKKKLQKGMYGFLARKKRIEIIKTVVLYAIALAVFFLGWLHTNTKQNMLSIVAVLGILPASKSAVSMIMFLRCKSAPESLYAQLRPAEERGILLYDLIFVLNEKMVKTDCIFVQDTSVVVYTQHKKMSEQEIAKQLKNFLCNQGKGKYAVQVIKNEQKFIKLVQSQLSGNDGKRRVTEQDEKIRDMLFGFSL